MGGIISRVRLRLVGLDELIQRINELDSERVELEAFLEMLSQEAIFDDDLF